MNPYSFILLFVAFATAFFALYSLRYPKAKGSLAFSLLLFSVTFYAFGYSLELESVTFAGKWRWIVFEYVGLATLPLSYLIFTARFTGFDRFLTPSVKYGLLTLPLLSFLIVATNPLHHLFYQQPEVVQSGTLSLLFFTRGPLYWFNLIYVYGFLFWSLLIQVHYLRTAAVAYRWQIRIILAGALVPWFVSLMQQAGLAPSGIDLGPVGFVFSCIACAVVFFRYRLFDVVPIALESVFESLSDGILLIDTEKKIIHSNRRMQELFPRLRAASYGQKCGVFFGQDPDLAGLSEGKYPQGELTFTRDEGEQIIHLIARIFPVFRRNLFVGQYIIVHNITDFIKYTRMLRANEKNLAEMNATKDLFFSIVAHDLRGPVANLVAMFDMLEENTEEITPQEKDEYMRVMRETSRSTYRFLENLLTWSGSQRGKIAFRPRISDLAALLTENVTMIQSAADAKKVKLECHFVSPMEAIFDQEMMSTVVRNLLSNALKFSFPEGTITLTASVEAGRAFVKVSDTGTGMSEETLQHIFTIPTERRSLTGTMGETGTGLGLMLCKEFVEKHGSRLEVESTPGQGSSFWFAFTFDPANI